MFSVASYNVLATAYIRPKLYAHCDPAVLQPAWRLPALARHVADLGADLLALQEVDAAIYAALEQALKPLGYAGHFMRKTGRKPDGCASFYRREAFTLAHQEGFDYADGSGHVALLLTLERGGRRIGLANTHLKWSAPGETHDPVQMHELLRMVADPARPGADWFICGDLNAKPESPVLAALAQAGYRPTHAAMQPGFTCNPNRAAKTIDYVCHTAAIRSMPLPLMPIDDLTPLPSCEQPSDHLAVVARFDWA
jgi:mRNA deadenylase 3'-5' endonuclease subunit Ccr4